MLVINKQAKLPYRYITYIFCPNNVCKIIEN